MIKPLALALALLAAPPVAAQDDDAFVTFRVLKPEVAQQLAEAALLSCRNAGYQVGVMVVDRFGTPQVFLRDRFAGLHVFETAHRKAWTAVSFRTATSALADITMDGSEMRGIRDLSMAMPLGGGLPVFEGDGSIVAGIGVSGAPGPSLDDDCAQAGIDAIEDQIAF